MARMIRPVRRGIRAMEIPMHSQIIVMATILVRLAMLRVSSQSLRVGPKTRWFRSQFSNFGEERLNAQTAQMKKTVEGMPGMRIPT